MRAPGRWSDLSSIPVDDRPGIESSGETDQRNPCLRGWLTHTQAEEATLQGGRQAEDLGS